VWCKGFAGMRLKYIYFLRQDVHAKIASGLVYVVEHGMND
jgi:hypothetical protein